MRSRMSSARRAYRAASGGLAARAVQPGLRPVHARRRNRIVQLAGERDDRLRATAPHRACVPLSINAFASRIVKRSSSTGASAACASDDAGLEDARSPTPGRPCVREHDPSESTALGSASVLPPLSASASLEQLDRLVEALGPECDLPEPGDGGRAARVPRLQARAVEALGLVDVTDAQRHLGLEQIRSARRTSASTPVASHCDETPSRTASSLTICSDGTRAPASRREMYAAVQPSNASCRCERPAVSRGAAQSDPELAGRVDVGGQRTRHRWQSSCLQSPDANWRHERCLDSLLLRARITRMLPRPRGLSFQI